MAGIQLASGFDLNSPTPLDSRVQFDTIALRNALPVGSRYEGLLVFVKEGGKYFSLTGGVANTNWIEMPTAQALAQINTALASTVKTVNGATPDEDGNVSITVSGEIDTSDLALKEEVRLKTEKLELSDLSSSVIDGAYSKNRLDPLKVTTGKYVQLNGAVSTNATYGHSDYIEVSEGDVIVGSSTSKSTGNQTKGIRFVTAYNENKEVVPTAGGENQPSYTVPVGVKFIIVSTASLSATSLEGFNTQIEVSSSGEATPFAAYFDDNFKINNSLLPIASESQFGLMKAGSGIKLQDGVISVETSNDEFFGLVKPKNIIDPSAVTKGRYMQQTGGTQTSAGYGYSGYLEVNEGEQLIATSKSLTSGNIGNIGFRFLAAFNENKEVVPAAGGENIPIYTVPAGIKYVVVSIPGLQNINVDFTFMVEKNSVRTNFENYFAPYYQLKKEAVPSPDVEVFLPSEICIAVGRTVEIYNRQAIWTGNMGNVHVQWISAVGKATRRKWSCEAVAGMVGSHPLTLNVYDNNMRLITSASTTIKVVQKAFTTAKNVLAIGDSLTNGKPWMQELRTLSGDLLKFVGTRWSGDTQGGNFNHEGRSGATSAWYVANSTYTFETNGVSPSNPFWNPTTSAFDFAYYKTTHSITPDVVQIYLGTNGITVNPEANANNIKAIVDGIRANDATIPIFLVNTLYRGGQDGIGKQLSNDGYSAGSGIWKLEEDRKVFNLMVRLKEILGSYTNVHFVPVALTHDSEFNFKNPSTTTNVNPRSTITEVQDVESTHPQPVGYLQMADIMYSTYCAHLT